MRLWGAIAEGLAARGRAVLVSIRDAAGSTPREAGARMVVFADGSFTGTIGGGTLEWRAIAEAQALISRSRSIAQAHDVDLTTGFHARSYALGPELGQCCGGRVSLGFETIDRAALPMVRQLAAREAEGAFDIEARIEGDVLFRRILSDPADLQPKSTLETFGDTLRTLLMFGAGHVGRALVLALAPLPFRVIWVDPRAGAFPQAVPGNVTLVRPDDPTALIASAPADAFVLVLTHSHALDLALCDAALRGGTFPYVGVIGSATKRARFERRLTEAGLAPNRIASLVCPIGAGGPKSKLPAVIAAATAVELLVADEMSLKVGHIESAGLSGRDAVGGMIGKGAHG